MNEHYNRDKNIVILLLAVTILLLWSCVKGKSTNNNVDYEPCGIDSAYIVDSLKEDYQSIEYIGDSIIKTDKQGNVYIEEVTD